MLIVSASKKDVKTFSKNFYFFFGFPSRCSISVATMRSFRHRQRSWRAQRPDAKIETAGIPLYLKGGDSPTIGTGGAVSVAQQSRVLSEPAEKSSGFDTIRDK
jgi:hypothetical protein